MHRLFASCYGTSCGTVLKMLYPLSSRGYTDDHPVDPFDDPYEPVRAKNRHLESVEEMEERDSLNNPCIRIYAESDETSISGRDSLSPNKRRYLGKIEVVLQYSLQKTLLIVTIVQATDLDLPDQETSTQLRVALLTDKSIKFKTKFLPGLNPRFKAPFTCIIQPEELEEAILRFRLYQKGAATRHLFLSETFISLKQLDTTGTTTTRWLRFRSNSQPASTMPSSPWKFNKNNNSDSTCDSPVLVPSPNTISPMPSISTHGSRRNSTIDDCGRFCALPEANGNAEVLVSLCYLENQGKLVVGLEKATGLEVPTLNKAPDTFAKISAVGQSGEEIGKHKTETIKACVDPNYGDSAVFSIHRNELENSNVQVQVFAHHGVLRRKIRIGYLCLGENSSSLDAQEHWQDMIQGMGTTVDKWHTLMKI